MTARAGRRARFVTAPAELVTTAEGPSATKRRPGRRASRPAVDAGAGCSGPEITALDTQLERLVAWAPALVEVKGGGHETAARCGRGRGNHSAAQRGAFAPCGGSRRSRSSARSPARLNRGGDRERMGLY